MKVLIIGNGGREHALAWKTAQSKHVKEVIVAPGNPGTAMEPKTHNVDIPVSDIKALADFAEREHVSLTIVGPEAPLVAGIVDEFRARGLKIFGPTRDAARLEGSKSFAKEFLERHGIPTARHRTFEDPAAAEAYVREQGAPIVIKADGLAAGKGVIVAATVDEAVAAVRDMLSGDAFGQAGRRVVIEEFLEGEEASFIVMSDGEHVIPMATSQDHKRVGDGDTGPNTGGMGAYSPAPVVTDQVHQRIMDRVILPAIRGMAEDGCPYTGFLYAGLMIDSEGNPRVIEFNCRFGDPETQPIMMRMKSDLAQLCLAGTEGRLGECSCEYDPRPAVGVVLAAQGYPQSPRKGDEIVSLPSVPPRDTMIFHAGTAVRDGRLVTSGGRVLCATALGSSVRDAASRAYYLASQVNWQGMFFRRDIGYRAVAREEGRDAAAGSL